MGKKKAGGKKKDSDETVPVCSMCKNFSPGSGSMGRCMKKEKKRAPDASTCSSFKPRR